MRQFVGIRVDDGLLAQIDSEAVKEDRTRSDMIRVIFKRYLEQNPVQIKPIESLGGLNQKKGA